jgi:hypothetical protein
MPNLFRIIGQALFRGESTTTGNALDVQDSAGTSRLKVANSGRITAGQDTTVTTETCAVITTDVTNANLVIAPNGMGAIIADIPDGGTAGGNARGDNAVDLQMLRGAATQVASGQYAVLIGGVSNTSSGTRSTVIGADGNNASGTVASILGSSNSIASGNFSTVCGGTSNTSSASGATVIGGSNNTASGENSIVIGSLFGLANLYGQKASSSGNFSGIVRGDAQTSSITARRSITGTGIADLTLDGGTPAAGNRAILNIASPGPTNARAWRAQIDLVAIVATAGGGGLVQNECFMGSYLVGIKRVGATTSLVGAVNTVNEVSDTNMATAVTTITADDTNEALKIEFTPPTTADGTTVIRVVATAYLTEVGR